MPQSYGVDGTGPLGVASNAISTRVGPMNRVLVASFVLIWVHTTVAEDKPLTGDLAKLQGVWKGTTGQDGRFQTVMTLKGQSGALDNTTSDGSKIGLKYKFDIDEKADPKRMHVFEIVRYGGNGSGPEHVYGIYRFIDADTIEICNGFDGKYPTEFQPGEQGKSFLFKLKRDTDAAKSEK
jgi:uncharacterized protein (TIGR03067 family)